MRLFWAIAVCLVIVLPGSSARAIGGACNINQVRNYPPGPINLGNVTATDGIVEFTYNDGAGTTTGTFSLSPATLGHFSIVFKGVYSGFPACTGFETAMIPISGVLVANKIE